VVLLKKDPPLATGRSLGRNRKVNRFAAALCVVIHTRMPAALLFRVIFTGLRRGTEAPRPRCPQHIHSIPQGRLSGCMSVYMVLLRNRSQARKNPPARTDGLVVIA
jgi:hypothetical protein